MALDFINSTFIFSLYPNLVTADKSSANIDINHIKDDFEQAMDAYKKSFDNNIDDNEYNSH